MLARRAPARSTFARCLSIAASCAVVGLLAMEASSVSGPGASVAMPPSGDAPWALAALLAEPSRPVALAGPGGSPGPLAKLPASAVALPAAVSVLVGLDFARSGELDRLLGNLSNSSSTQFHHFLSASQFDQAFGPPLGMYEGAVGYFASFGVQRLTTYADRAAIGFVATPSQVREIFHASLRSVEQNGAPYVVPAGPVALPASLAPWVSGVTGLDTRPSVQLATLSLGPSGAPVARVAPGRPLSPLPSSAQTPCRGNGGPFNCTTVGKLSYPEPVSPFQQLVFGSDLQVAYNETNSSGKGILQTSGYPVGSSIATILWTEPVNTSKSLVTYCSSLKSGTYAWDFYAPDVASYFNYTLPKGEPKPHVYSVALNGVAAYANGSEGRSASCQVGPQSASLEDTLDVEMAGSMAPGANVYQVFGQTDGSVDTSLADILNPSSGDGPGFTPSVIAGLSNISVISNSWTSTNVTGFDKVWDNEEAEAQARGITILASTGDSGLDLASPPADVGLNSYGTTAVGGTTLILDPSTLLRSPYTTGTNPYTYCPVSTTNICGGETAWEYSTGGVATIFAEPSWQKDASDANKVVRSVGIGRGEPDIAAIANQTLLTVTLNGTQYNATAVANLSLKRPFWPITGTSISAPVEAGIVAVVDHALYASQHPWMGFLDPALYSWGQREYAGSLKSGPFFDVIYGRNFNDTALRGYDLVTGWGPLDATNFGKLAEKLTAVWSNVSTSSYPPAAYGASSAYDAKDGYLLQFGGVKANGTAFGTTWSYSGGVWTAVSTSGHPPARWGAGMAYDAKDGYVVLFGGLGNASAVNPIYNARNDTWVYSGGTWTLLSPKISPPGRVWAGMVYDAKDGVVMLFGGCPTDLCAPGYSSWMNDTWEFSGGAWTQVNASVHPSGRQVGQQMTYDNATASVLLFGGYGYLGTTRAHSGMLDDTWTFAKGTWKNVTSGVAPPGRSGGDLAYDPSVGYAVLFGGQVNSSLFLGSTWGYQAGSWSNLTAPRSPSLRAFSSFAYDPKDKSLVLWGGINWVKSYLYRYLDDTWVYG